MKDQVVQVSIRQQAVLEFFKANPFINWDMVCRIGLHIDPTTIIPEEQIDKLIELLIDNSSLYHTQATENLFKAISKTSDWQYMKGFFWDIHKLER